MDLDLIAWAGMLLTFIILLGYLLGDNPLYRWSVALLVGVGAGYVFAVTAHFLVRWTMGGVTGEQHPVLVLPPLIFGFLLLLKGFPKLSPVGNISMGLLLGVGVAVAISGALLGTLLPQMANTGRALVLDQGWRPALEGVLMIVGTLLALFAFSPHPFLAGEEPSFVEKGIRWAGQTLVALALAVAFAGALTSALTLLLKHWWTFVVELLLPLLGA
ncbi:MAG: hypothetical protein ACP5HM_09875 [Anaerolineae bacterium]